MQKYPHIYHGSTSNRVMATENVLLLSSGRGERSVPFKKNYSFLIGIIIAGVLSYLAKICCGVRQDHCIASGPAYDIL